MLHSQLFIRRIIAVHTASQQQLCRISTRSMWQMFTTIISNMFTTSRIRFLRWTRQHINTLTAVDLAVTDKVNGTFISPIFKSRWKMKIIAVTGYKPFELGIFKQDEPALQYIKAELQKADSPYRRRSGMGSHIRPAWGRNLDSRSGVWASGGISSVKTCSHYAILWTGRALEWAKQRVVWRNSCTGRFCRKCHA